MKYLSTCSARKIMHKVMHQSIPDVPIPPPPSSPGNCRVFAHVVSPGGGVFTMLSWPGGGGGISVPWGNPRAQGCCLILSLSFFNIPVKTHDVRCLSTCSARKIMHKIMDCINQFQVPTPPGNHRVFAHVFSPEVGYSQFYRGPGARH